MAKTDENLQAAFAGESQANRKYLAFAKAADQEGLAQVARLFRAAAEAETVHAHNHLRVMGGVGKTADNLQAAIAGETYEFQKTYPAFIKQAEKDSNGKAGLSFQYANRVEQVHAALYKKAADAVAGGKDLPAAALYVCLTCGNTVEGDPPASCPVCGSGRDRFKKID
ncbi:MAG: rubrerythrin family protein [Planctomycetes bacterium]|nr:rubrerythrin family protein [Planctomycetota bacterium]